MRENKDNKASIIYVNKWIVMLTIIVTATIGFFLGFIVGENHNKNQNTITSTIPVETSSKDTINHSEVQKMESQPVSDDNKNNLLAKEQKIDNLKEEISNKQVKNTESNKSNNDSNNSKKYTIQVGAFKNEVEAIALKTKLKKKGYNAYVVIDKTKKNGDIYKVKVGEFLSREEARIYCNKLKANERLKPFVTIK